MSMIGGGGATLRFIRYESQLLLLTTITVTAPHNKHSYCSSQQSQLLLLTTITVTAPHNKQLLLLTTITVTAPHNNHSYCSSQQTQLLLLTTITVTAPHNNQTEKDEASALSQLTTQSIRTQPEADEANKKP